MKFVATEDIRAPREEVWPHVADIDRWEGMIAAKTKRLDRRPPGPAAVGTTWDARASIRDKDRDVTARLVRMDEPGRLTFETRTDGMEVTFDVMLEEKGPHMTRLSVVTEAKAKSLTARLLLQSAKLARGQMAKRYKARVAAFAARLEGDRKA
ncbi:SRPBCC family protein [Jannaschia aquimarina]|uniref:Polyketide cyclase / dehydrase and lipid transport n=1 Tax=Jannaschia aquimarina TaxID=935700 RepID=A0A0D1EQ40_9RHOB|nr:SRPBCC family protein [Jannaschia aquimarina]KIT17730.1 Polyketide cyclase / dehydrase and lipid transport [Jannaschia aquimarina]SNS77960.1 Polyketide cyclase / dehydrase and lipid transport [Jannaschia aquimarina]